MDVQDTLFAFLSIKRCPHSLDSTLVCKIEMLIYKKKKLKVNRVSIEFLPGGSLSAERKEQAKHG